MKRTTILVLLLCTLTLSLSALDIETDIVGKAKTHIGTPYRTGGTQPPAFDCSGFVGYIVRPYVPRLPRLSRDMASFGTPVSKSALKTGDLVFFATTEVSGAISHVALYIGDGSVIHAISDGPERGVRISSLESRYWKNHYHSAVRILPETAITTKPQASPAAKPSPIAKPSPTPAPLSAPSPVPATSPWDTWDGYIAGDYEQWKAQQQKDFEEYQKAYDKNAEMSEFEKWKKTQE